MTKVNNPKPNLELAERVKEQILAHPQNFDMSRWVHLDKDPFNRLANWFRGNPEPNCGTAACIGGWTCLLSDVSAKSLDDASSTTVETTARHMLGLTYEEGHRLFYYDNWDADLNDAYIAAGLSNRPELAAEAAGKMIDRIMEQAQARFEKENDVEVLHEEFITV